MHLVQAEMHLLPSQENAVWAYGIVTIDRVLRFSIQVRRIKSKTGEEVSIMRYPRRKYQGNWEDVVIPDSELKDEIRKTVMQEIRTEIQKDLYPIPVEVVHLTRIKEPRDGICPILAVATVKLCGLQIKGITVKRGKDGLFCNMPQYRENDTGEYRDMVYGMTKAVRDQICQVVLACYQEV